MRGEKHSPHPRQRVIGRRKVKGRRKRLKSSPVRFFAVERAKKPLRLPVCPLTQEATKAIARTRKNRPVAMLSAMLTGRGVDGAESQFSTVRLAINQIPLCDMIQQGPSSISGAVDSLFLD